MARILIVEDELVAAESIQEFLERSEHTVIARVTSGTVAIRLAAELKPDLVLMDICLEGELDGIAAAAQILEQLKIPVIYLTANTENQTLQRAIATEPFGYLVKPFNQVELYTAISIALRRYQLEQQLETTEQWLSNTLCSIGDGAIATDLNGCITFINPVAADLIGWERSEVLGEPANQVLNLVDAETGEVINNPLLQAMQEGEPVSISDQCLLRTREGLEVAIGDTATPIRNDQGEIIGGVLVFQDLRERRQAEAQLYQQREDFRTVVENSPDGIARFDRTLHCVYANPAFAAILQQTAQDVVGKRSAELGLPVHLVNLWNEGLQRTFATGTPQSIEFEFPPTQETQIYQAHFVPEMAANASISGVLMVVRNITEYRQTQEMLRQQAERERLLSTIVQHIRQSLDLDQILNTTVTEVRHLLQTDRVIIYRFEADQSGFVIVESIGEAWLPMLGRQLYDPCMTTETCIQAYREGRVSRIENLQASGLPECYVDLLTPFQVQANLVIPILQGEQLWGLLVAQQCAAPRHWQEWEVDLLQQLANHMSIAIQQSELYQRTQQLNTQLDSEIQERTARLRQAFTFEATLKRITDKVRDSLSETEILQDAVQELALAIGVQTCNAALYDLERRMSTICYEYSTSNVPFQSYVFPMNRFSEGYHQLLQGQYFQFCGLTVPEVDRMARLVCPISDDQGVLGDLWLINHVDYSFSEQDIRLVQLVANQCAIAIRQSRLYQAAQTQVTELEQLNRLKDDFLSTVSHELRTPMSNIKMAIQMLEIVLRPLGLLDAGSASRYFQILQNECQREISLVENLLELSRLDTRHEPLILSTIEPSTWLRRAVEPFGERLQNRQQNLVLQIPPELPIITSDTTYLERILAELLDNASKYSPEAATITVFARATSDAIQFGVSNSGVEIPANELPRIFDKFYRVPSHDPWRHSGTGLGLAVAQRLVNRLGATIQVESANQQTTFTVTLSIGA